MPMTPLQQRLRQDRSALEFELKVAGAEIRGTAVRCPFHDDRHASGSLYQDDSGTWRYRCQVPTCAVGGDVFDIRARVSGRPLADVLKEADPDRPASTSRSTGQTAQPHKVHRTLADLRQAVAWVAAQDDCEIENEYQYTNPGTGTIDLCVFRLWKPGVLHNKKFKQAHPVPGGWVMTAGEKPWPLYRRAEIAGVGEIVVAEGEKTADALNCINIAATTSPCGAGKAQYANWSPLAGKTVYLWPDNDEVGRKHMKDVQTMIERLDSPPTVRLIEPSDLDLGTKEDAYDFIEQCKAAGMDPRQAVLNVLAKAKRIDALSEYRIRQEAIVRGELRPVPLPYPQLTQLTRAGQPGRVLILAGSKGSAKSFLRLECQRFWLDGGEKVLLYLMEGSVAEELDRALAQLTGNPDFTDPEWQREHPGEVRATTDQYAETLASLAASIVRSPIGATMDDVATWIEEEAPRKRILCVDPVTMAMPVRNPWDDAKMLLDRAKHAAETHGCSIMFVSHLQKGAQAGDIDRLAGGAAFERFSDTIIQLHRHEPRQSNIRTPLGRMEATHNQTVFIEKARAPGTGYRLAFTFAMAGESGDGGPLTFSELGVIVKKGKD